MARYVLNPFTGQFDDAGSGGGGTGDVSGPGLSVVGNIATWNDITGTLLADSGKAFSTDGTFAADSDDLIPTQKAIKTYVDNSPSGTVTSVSGTTDRVTSSGGTTPVIDIASTYVGQTSITTLGTVVTGVWNGTAIAAPNGGTGQTGYAVGDVLYASTTTALSKLVAGSDGQVLTLASGIPSWATPAPVNPKYTYTAVSSSPYVVLVSDYFIGVDTTATRTIQLPNAPATGSVWVVKDSTGNAATNNITVTTVGGIVTIDGAATKVINGAYNSLNFIFNGTSYEVW